MQEKAAKMQILVSRANIQFPSRLQIFFTRISKIGTRGDKSADNTVTCVRIKTTFMSTERKIQESRNNNYL